MISAILSLSAVALADTSSSQRLQDVEKTFHTLYIKITKSQDLAAVATGINGTVNITSTQTYTNRSTSTSTNSGFFNSSQATPVANGSVPVNNSTHIVNAGSVNDLSYAMAGVAVGCAALLL